jgi:hypothetical protein
MQNFFWIFKNYFKRATMDKANLLALILLPFGLIAINVIIHNFNAPDDADFLRYGYNMMATNIATGFIVSFQFFGIDNLGTWLFQDFKSERKWRLTASPVPQKVFFLAGATAIWINTMLQSAVLAIASTVIFNVYWGNLWVTVATFAIMSLMVQLIAILAFYTIKDMGSVTGLTYGISFLFMALSGWLMIPRSVFEGIPGVSWLVDYNPVTLAIDTIRNAGFMGDGLSYAFQNLGILGAMVAVLAVSVFILGRRKAL